MLVTYRGFLKYAFLMFCLFSCQEQRSEVDAQEMAKFNDYLSKSEEAYYRLDYTEALDHAKKAYKLAGEWNNSEMLSKTYTRKAAIYSNLELYNESLSYIHKAFRENYTKSDLHLQAELYERRAYTYTGLGFYKLARENCEKIIRIIPGETKNSTLGKFRASAYELIGVTYGMEFSALDSVYKYTNESISVLRKFPESDVCESISLSYLQIAQGYMIENKKDSARSNLNRSIDLIKKCGEELKDQHYEHLGYYYQLKGEPEKALEYYFLTLKMYENSNEVELNALQIYRNISEVYHELGNYEKEKEYLKIYTEKSDHYSVKSKKNAAYALKLIVDEKDEQKHIIEKRLFIAMGTSIPLIFLLIWYFVRERRSRKNSVHLMGIKEEEIQVLKKKMGESFDELIQMAKENHPHFWIRFQEVYPEFRNKLFEHCENLKTSELTFCAYIYLGFTTKEIASYTFRAIKTIENNRYNIRKRLKLKPEEDFVNWLHTLMD